MNTNRVEWSKKIGRVECDFRLVRVEQFGKSAASGTIRLKIRSLVGDFQQGVVGPRFDCPGLLTDVVPELEDVASRWLAPNLQQFIEQQEEDFARYISQFGSE